MITPDPRRPVEAGPTTGPAAMPPQLNRAAWRELFDSLEAGEAYRRAVCALGMLPPGTIRHPREYPTSFDAREVTR